MLLLGASAGQPPAEACGGEAARKWRLDFLYVHAEAGYQLLPQRQFLPGLHVRGEAGAPTATCAGLGTGLWRLTGKTQVAKSFHSFDIP
jgi:hypothetical protein